jgi:putative NADH-flavin reductase
MHILHNDAIIVIGAVNKHPAAMKLRENPAYDSRYQPHAPQSAEAVTSTLERRQLEHTYESLSNF